MTTNVDVDAIFDLASGSDTSTATDANTTPTTDSTATDANTTEGNADGSSEAAGGAIYPKVLRSYVAAEFANGENPPDTYTIAEFAGHMTLENLTKKGKGLDGIVKDAAIYTGVRGSRDPLPVVLVFDTEEDKAQDNQKNVKVYLPIAEATEAWEARKPRGEGGNAAASKRSQEDLLEDAAKKLNSLNAIVTRRKRAEEQEKKASDLLVKYHNWLAQFYLGTEIEEVEETDKDGNVTKRPETQDEANKRALRNAIAEKAAELAELEAAKADAANDTDESQNA